MSNWHSLAVFSIVAEEGSFSAAAKKLEITQPTVSFHIDNLEESFGCQLFQRSARGVTLTVYGQLLLQHSRKINAQMAIAEQQIKAMLTGAAGEIIIGCSTIPSEYILPELIAQFMRSHPEVRFSLHTGDSEKIMTGFNQGLFPIAIVGRYPGNEYDVIELCQDEIVLIGHPDSRALLGDVPAALDILTQPFITRRDSSGSQHAADSSLEEIGLSSTQLRIVLEVDTNEALKSAVLNHIGLAFISRRAIQAELSAGSLMVIPLPGKAIHRSFYALCHKPLLPTCLENFWGFLAVKV